MKNRFVMGAFTMAVLAVSGAVADEALKSSTPVGQKIPGAFHPTNITGAQAGKKHCLVWQNGGNSVAMIFAREVSDSLTSLVKKIDAATAENKDKKMGSFVVFLSDDEKLGDQLKSLAEKEGLKKCVLSIDNVAGPKGYDVAKEAAVTVVLYNKRQVESNHAFRKGELNDKGIDKVLADLPKILK